MPQRDPAEVTVVPEPPPGRAGYPALRPWRLLERLGAEGPHERREALSRMPRLAEGPDLVPDHGVVVGRAAPLGGELGHCGQERLADLERSEAAGLGIAASEQFTCRYAGSRLAADPRRAALRTGTRDARPDATSRPWSALWDYLSRPCQSIYGCFETQESWQPEWTGHAGFTGFRRTRWRCCRLARAVPTNVGRESRLSRESPRLVGRCPVEERGGVIVTDQLPQYPVQASVQSEAGRWSLRQNAT